MLRAVLLLWIAASAMECGKRLQAGPPAADGEESAITVPTPADIVAKMLELANVDRDDVLYDLGCGDGRIVVAAAVRYGCRAVGYDIHPVKVRQSRERVRLHGVDKLVRIEQQDIFQLDLREASVITLYLLPEMNDRLVPQLQQLQDGSRVVCHEFPIDGFEHDQLLSLKSREDGVRHDIYLYTLPLRASSQR
jgi:SAM-dependent methyltransferase